MKKHDSKLVLRRETLAPLQREHLEHVVGGQGQEGAVGDGADKSRTWFQSVAFCMSNHCSNCGPRGRDPAPRRPPGTRR